MREREIDYIPTWAYWAIVLALVCLGLYTYIVLQKVPPTDRTAIFFYTVIVSIIGTIGSFASIIGLIVAYQQILQLRKDANLIQNKVNESLLRINEITTIGDITKSIQVIREIQSHINDGRFNIAHLRMKDVKSALLGVRHEVEGKTLYSNPEFDNLMQTYSLDLSSLNSILTGKKRDVNQDKVNENLEEIATVLIQLQNYIKNPVRHG